MPDRFSKKINTILHSLLGVEGLNVLGEYEVLLDNVIVGNTPSCRVRKNDKFVRRMVPKSGIEVIIELNPEIDIKYQKFGTIVTEVYLVTLDQHDPDKTLDTTLSAICAHRTIRPLKSPIVRPRVEEPGQKGELPARALLYIPNSEYQEDLF